jgi:hypothetical protein
MSPKERYWERCEHCMGSTVCTCEECRVYYGPGFIYVNRDKYSKGPCTICGGKGGKWKFRKRTPSKGIAVPPPTPKDIPGR